MEKLPPYFHRLLFKQCTCYLEKEVHCSAKGRNQKFCPFLPLPSFPFVSHSLPFYLHIPFPSFFFPLLSLLGGLGSAESGAEP